MKLLLTFFFIHFLSSTLFAQLNIRKNLDFTPEHFPEISIPKGILKGPFTFHSKILTGTSRQYWLFIPAQYKATQPASILIFHDGFRAQHPQGSLRVPQVMEHLIAKGEIPVTIGIFISPGNRSEEYPGDLEWGNPNNRAQEYDAMDNRYARFIVEEMLPEIAKKYQLTTDPNQRAIGGTSSGAIAAFTVAWHYPNMFRKVYSSIGSYVSIGFKPDEAPIKIGGQDYPALIRRTVIPPMRIYLHDGSNDLDNEWGNWFLANQQMVTAMKYANRQADTNQSKGPRYEVKTVWTDGAHNDKHAGILLPEGLKWLWENDL